MEVVHELIDLVLLTQSLSSAWVRVVRLGGRWLESVRIDRRLIGTILNSHSDASVAQVSFQRALHRMTLCHKSHFLVLIAFLTPQIHVHHLIRRSLSCLQNRPLNL